MITQEEALKKIEDLKIRLRWWETGVWMRHAESPTPFARSIDCLMCKGTGRAHFCINDECDGEAKDECLHPNEAELADYARLMTDLKNLKNLVMATAKKMQQEKPDPRKLVEHLLSGLARQ